MEKEIKDRKMRSEAYPCRRLMLLPAVTVADLSVLCNHHEGK